MGDSTRRPPGDLCRALQTDPFPGHRDTQCAYTGKYPIPLFSDCSTPGRKEPGKSAGNCHENFDGKDHGSLQYSLYSNFVRVITTPSSFRRPRTSRSGFPRINPSASHARQHPCRRYPALGSCHAVTSPVKVFRPCSESGLRANPLVYQPYMWIYDVSPDGRFLFNCMSQSAGRFMVWMNWRPADNEGAR